MNDIALRVDGVGKLYQLGQSRSASSLREAIASAFYAPLRRQKLMRADTRPDRSHTDQLPDYCNTQHLWALQDVSFEIRKGETVGIIGPNGSGKSTLLKLLAEITEPTVGEIAIDGRLTALIELGAGFHPELSGRENIYLNGAILGLSKQEIDRKFSEILDFAELHDFVDTPLKHFSSGMTVRLGFSLAVHVNPDILLVDEVLAVGDAAFRRRCFAKIDEFIRAKKTIIIVTHNLPEVQRVAHRLILIQKGKIHADGQPDVVIDKYANLLRAIRPRQGDPGFPSFADGISGLPISITDVRVTGRDGEKQDIFTTHAAMQVQISYRADRAVNNPVFRVQIYRSDGVFCHGMNTARHGLNLGKVQGPGVITLHYQDLSLVDGDYTIHTAVFLDSFDELPVHQWFNPASIRIESAPVDGGGIFAMPTEWRVGV